MEGWGGGSFPSLFFELMHKGGEIQRPFLSLCLSQEQGYRMNRVLDDPGHPSYRRAPPALGQGRGEKRSFLRYIPAEFRFTKRRRGAEGLSCSLVSGFCCLLLQLVTADRARFCHLRLISLGWAVPRAAWDGPSATQC